MSAIRNISPPSGLAPKAKFFDEVGDTCLNVDACIEVCRQTDTPKARAIYRAFRKRLATTEQGTLSAEKHRENAFFDALHDLGSRQRDVERKREKRAHDKRLRVGVGAQVQAINRGPKVAVEKLAVACDANSLKKPLLDLDAFDCRWPDAERNGDGLHTFCGHPAQAGSSFCPAHHARCWQPRVAPTKQSPHYRERAAA